MFLYENIEDELLSYHDFAELSWEILDNHHPPHLIECPFRNPIQHGSSQRIRTIFQGVRVFLIFFEPCLNKIERIGEEMLTLGEYRVDKLSDSFIERTPD